jgi:hypothetical protein
MTALTETARFLREARSRLRFGETSREPLLLLRVEWKGDWVECDWLMRPVDPWDKYLPSSLATENQTQQALRDALKLREIVFRCFPAVHTAQLRMFRSDEQHQLELVLIGRVSRDNEILHRVASLAMRARLCGLRFTLADGASGGMVPMGHGCL